MTDDISENNLKYLPFIGAGLILVPDLFVWNANITGQSGIYYPLFLGLVLVAYFVQIKAIHRLPSEMLLTHFGPFVTNFITVLARLPLLFFLPVSILVAAGFVFNEVFVHWFPNFGFAGLLLFLVAIFQIFAKAHLLNLQAKTVICAGLLWLILMIFGVTQPGSEKAAKDFSGIFSILGGAGFILTFVGIDMMLSHPLLSTTALNRIRTRALMVLITSGLIIGFWSAISLFWMGAEQMTDSYIPHIITARRILGNWGRYIMGTMVILGVIAGMNVLFAGLYQVTNTLKRTGYLSLLENSHQRLNTYLIIFVAIIVGGLMMVGIAGTDIIDVWVHACLFLWLLYWVAVQAACVLENWKNQEVVNNILHLVSVFLLIAMLLAVIIGYPEKKSLFGFISIAAVSVAVLVFLLGFMQKTVLMKNP